jgi:asparagine synthetase B (glutamine-hydrolysing)
MYPEVDHTLNFFSVVYILQNEGYIQLKKSLMYDLQNIWHHDLLRDTLLAHANAIELELPYLESDFVNYCLSISPKLKLKQTKDGLIRKYILKELGRYLDIPDNILKMKKTAMQYGSGSTKSLKRLAINSGATKEMAKSYDLDSGTELLTKSIFQILKFPLENESKIPSDWLNKIKNEYNLLNGRNIH